MEGLLTVIAGNLATAKNEACLIDGLIATPLANPHGFAIALLRQTAD